MDFINQKKMNELIIISESTDVSTDKVISYLSHPFKRINIDIIGYTGLIQLINNQYENTVVWLRRGDFFKLFSTHPIRQLKSEYNSFVYYLFYLFEKTTTKTIGSLAKDYDHNKLKDIKIAESLGIKTPKTFIHNSNVHQDYKKEAAYITKMNKAPISLLVEKKIKLETGFTTVINKDFIENEVALFPSVIQEKIDKKFEVRTFFVEDEYYSMAIFSQADETTATDYRNYNRKKPNRVVPFSLPKELELKLKKLMHILELSTGSIDLIYSKDKQFYFLEVNPCGQFDWLSVNCNYNIEKSIATILESS